MEIEHLASLFRHEQRALAAPGEVLEQRPFVTRRSTADGKLHWVMAHELSSEDVDRAIQEEIEFFKGKAGQFEWKTFSFDTPANLADRLQEAGFVAEDVEAIMVYDFSSGLVPLRGGECQVRRVQTEADLDDFRQVAEAVFGKDYSLTVGQLREAIAQGSDHHRGYVGYVEDEPVAVGRLYVSAGSSFAGLYGGGVLKEFRGRGLYREMIWSRAADAIVARVPFLLVDALTTSRPILERLGFRQMATTVPCVYTSL